MMTQKQIVDEYLTRAKDSAAFLTDHILEAHARSDALTEIMLVELIAASRAIEHRLAQIVSARKEVAE